MTFSEMAAELGGAEAALPLALARAGAQLAEEGRGLGRDNAAARVYGPASGRGTLGDSVRGRSTATAEDVLVELTAGEAGTPAGDYARAQELGATIRPRRAALYPRPRTAPMGAASRRRVDSFRAGR